MWVQIQNIAEIQKIYSKKSHTSKGRKKNTLKKTNPKNKTKVLPSLNCSGNYQVRQRISS